MFGAVAVCAPAEASLRVVASGLTDSTGYAGLSIRPFGDYRLLLGRAATGEFTVTSQVYFQQYEGQDPSDWNNGQITGTVSFTNARDAFVAYLGSYTGGYYVDPGTVSFTSNQPYTSYVIQEYFNVVPEPATWAMLVIGFGAIGGTMRMRSRQRHPA